MSPATLTEERAYEVAARVVDPEIPVITVADLGILHAGGTSVGLYETVAPDQVAYVAGHCDATVAVVPAWVVRRTARQGPDLLARQSDSLREEGDVHTPLVLAAESGGDPIDHELAGPHRD